MRRKDAIKNKNTVKLIVFRNGFLEYFRMEDIGGLIRVKVRFPTRKRRKRPSMKKFSFRPPIPGLPF